jgi:alkaline phosphatase D
MKTYSSLFLAAVFSFSAFFNSVADDVASVDEKRLVSRLAFGSCLRDPSEALILDKVVEYKPDIFVWLGDNVYIDTMEDKSKFEKVYDRLGANPRFRKLQETSTVLAIWDDHDYGADNYDKTYPLKEHSKKVFGKFWGIDKASPVWSRDGIYQALEYGPEKQRVQVVLLDGRWNLNNKNTKDPDSYLGKAQWAWLESVLKRPAKLRVICSGVQVVKVNAVSRGWEMWGHYPSERQRLFDLIADSKAEGVVFVSGDMHFSEIYRTTDTAYPLYDLTASGLDQGYKTFGKAYPGPEKLGESYLKMNFGSITVDWKTSSLSLEVRDEEGRPVNVHKVKFSELGFK